MKIVKKKIKDLTRNTQNVRKHSEKQIKEYVRSLEKFGQVRPIVIDEAGVIIAGNGMYDAVIALGWDSVECYVAAGLSENDKKKLMLADNKVYDLGITDMTVFDEIIAQLDGDFDIPGYDDKLLNMIHQSTAAATEAVMSYGHTEIAAEEPVRRTPEAFGETAAQVGGVSPYAQAEPPTEEQQEPQGRQYVVCPKCGEKIWL